MGSKWVNITLSPDLELRLETLAWGLPAWQLSVASSRLMTTAPVCHDPCDVVDRKRARVGLRICGIGVR